MSGGVFFDPRGVTTNGNVIAINDYNEFQKRIREEAFPPVMSYFEPSKQTTSGNNFITSQRDRFNQLISESKKIAVIGIRIRDHDEHIWESLKNTSANIIYCSGKEDAARYEAWRGNKPNRSKDQIIPSFWDTAFSTINSEMLQ